MRLIMRIPAVISGELIAGLIFSVIFPITGYSGVKPNESIYPSDTLHGEGRKLSSSLFAGGGYGSNMIYLGSSISRNQPYNYYFLSFGINNDFSIAASGFHNSGLSPLISYYTFSVNYNHNFGSLFDISAGMYRYQVNRSVPDTIFTSFNYGDFTTGFDWKILYTQLNLGALFADKPQVYLQVKNSRYFKLAGIFKDKLLISVNPYASLLFGNIVTAETYYGEYKISVTQEYINPVTQSPGTGISSGGYGHGSGYGQSYGSGTGSASGGSSTSVTVTSTTIVPYTEIYYKKNFGLIDAEFGLPLSVNTGRLTFETELYYVLPAYNYPGFRFKDGFVLMFTGLIKVF